MMTFTSRHNCHSQGSFTAFPRQIASCCLIPCKESYRGEEWQLSPRLWIPQPLSERIPSSSLLLLLAFCSGRKALAQSGSRPSWLCNWSRVAGPSLIYVDIKTASCATNEAIATSSLDAISIILLVDQIKKRDLPPPQPVQSKILPLHGGQKMLPTLVKPGPPHPWHKSHQSATERRYWHRQR